MSGPQNRSATVAPTGVAPAASSVVRRATRVFVVVLVALGAGHLLFLAAPSLQVLTILDLSLEQSLGTWVASSLHLLCAAVSAAGALLARREGSRWTGSWWLLAAVFLVMSADETAAGHDRLVGPLQERFATSGVLLYPWVVVGLVLGAAFLLVQLRFLRSLGRTGTRLVLAGGVFVLGAAGLEMLEGVVASPGGPGRDTLQYDLLVLAEELMEVGALMWVACILGAHVLAWSGDLRLLVGRSPARQPERPDQPTQPEQAAGAQGPR